ncbi:secreted protein [Actinokineospora spheciospongiae]|uniref:Secreted protein n=1 Tax=Actinokineospora spheciospongiae TaxID=909613 RepID=W7IXE9_9PSEU|nr:secreted protein [Actinokineospora spheciospongiae]
MWFVIAVVAFIAGGGFLLRDRALLTSRNRERRRWAGLRGWQFAETDPLLPKKWSGGAVAYYGDGVARDVVAGSTFTADGRRKVFVFDLEAGGRVNTVIAAVQTRKVHPVVVELWVPSTPFQREHMPELLGPVGQRYAFVSDISGARALITPDLVDATEEIGRDIAVAWIEDGWVLAAAPPNSSPSRLERLLRGIGEIADVVDPFDAEAEPAGGARPEQAGAERVEAEESRGEQVKAAPEPVADAKDA